MWGPKSASRIPGVGSGLVTVPVRRGLFWGAKGNGHDNRCSEGAVSRGAMLRREDKAVRACGKPVFFC